jgi:multiple sugar transport system substrate-binding protein
MKKQILFAVVVVALLATMAGCGATPEPQVVEVTRMVEGTPQTVEVTKVVEVTTVPEPAAEQSLVFDPDTPVTITWWGTEKGRDTATTRELHFELARAFEEKYPNVKVAVSLFPSRGFATRIATVIAAGEGPDVWYHYYSPDIATHGFLEDLTPFIERDGLNPEEMWFPIGRVRATYEGKYYGVPRDVTSGFIAYNKDLFDAAGIAYPEDGWTVEDYRNIAIQITDEAAGVYGVGAIVGGPGGIEWSPFSFNLGTDIISPDGKQLVGYMDTPEAIAAFKWLMDLKVKDKVTAPAGMSEQFGELVFLSGQVAMQSISTWELAALNEGADFQWGVVNPPRFNAETEDVAWADAYMYYLWSGSPHKAAAWEFLKFLSGPEAAQMLADSGVWTPNSPAVWQAQGWENDPVLGVAWTELERATKVPNYLRSQYHWDCTETAVQNIWTRYTETGETDLEAIVKEEVQIAQPCLDDSYSD